MNLHSLARALGGEVSGSQVLCPGLGHSAGDRSLAVRFTGDKFTCHSFSGDDWQTCRDHVRAALGIANDRPPRLTRPTVPDKQNNARVALAIWDEARPIAGTLAERYLASRGLTIPPEATTALRYHPECIFGSERVPAMIAAMTSIETNVFRGIHRTRLEPKCKMMLGKASGSVVRLSPDDDVTGGLHISEGIETSLAIMGMGFKPVWATVSAGGMAKLPVLPGIESLTVFADNDESGAGLRAAKECARRWRSAGREARIFMAPKAGTDFADWVAA